MTANANVFNPRLFMESRKKLLEAQTLQDKLAKKMQKTADAQAPKKPPPKPPKKGEAPPQPPKAPLDMNDRRNVRVLTDLKPVFKADNFEGRS